MSGRWIILGDTRVNVAAQVPERDSQPVVEALSRLYAVHRLCEPERSTGEYQEDHNEMDSPEA